MRRFWRSERGQILIPSIFLIPSMFLFVFLIYETARLSREKIRHQFALDSAAFIEMTNYADFLNRSAYVNGAFPQRIFKEGFYETKIDSKKNIGVGATKRLYEILYEGGDGNGGGLFPSMADPMADSNTSMNALSTWDIKFGGCGVGKNTDPSDDACKDDHSSADLPIIRYQDALDYYISWEDAQEVYKLYVQIYQLLGSVEEAQYSVLDRLRDQHTFFRKSYWMNTGGNAMTLDEPGEGAIWFGNQSFTPKAQCINTVTVYGNKPTGSVFQPYQVYSPDAPIGMDGNKPGNLPGCSGLFHLMTVPDDQIQSMNSPSGVSSYPGYGIFQHWQAPPNYFKVDFNSLMGIQDDCPGGDKNKPCVRATISLINQVGGGAVGGSLWPNPTPKFQTRLYP